MNSSVPHPGKILKEEFLDPLGITPYRLAKSIGVHVRRVSEIVHGNRRITPDTAVRLGLFFDVPAVWWLEMQARYDADKPALIEALRPLVSPWPGLSRAIITPHSARRLTEPPAARQGAILVNVPGELVARLRAQAALAPARAPRRVRTVILENGAPMLTGDEE